MSHSNYIKKLKIGVYVRIESTSVYGNRIGRLIHKPGDILDGTFIAKYYHVGFIDKETAAYRKDELTTITKDEAMVELL